MVLARIWVASGAVAGLIAVAVAALAVHLPADPAALRLLASGAQIEGWHALALVLCGVWAAHANRVVHVAGLAFLAGMLLFCGDVYALALLGWHIGVAPVGGVLLMAGWACLGLSSLSKKR